ncbi:MAG TPA: DUF885 family protein, partial [Gemmatimonadaceae bacterium]|nr:DUF885 family protein [Gemmatimonadaceae bacterium]
MTAPSRLTTPTRGDAAAAQALGDGPVGRALARWYALFPVDATFAGLHDHDDRLPDWSPDGLARAADELRALRATLAPVEPPAPGATPHGVDRAVLDAALEVRAAELEGPHFHRGNPSLFAGEAVFSVIALVTRDFAPAAERAERLAARLGAIPRFLADAPRTIAGPIPAAWSARALRDAKGAAIF